MKRVPLVVWVLVGLNAALLSLYALLFPPYTGFDEPQHVDMTIHLAKGETWPWPGPGELPLSVPVANSSNPVYFDPTGPVQSSLRKQPFDNDFVKDRAERKTIGELATPTPSVPNYPNQMVQHPPAYYVLAATVLKAWPGSIEDMRYDVAIGWLRLLSVLLLAPLPLLAWKAVSLLSTPPVAVMGATLTLAVPGLLRVGSNVQNDDLLILGCSGLLLALTRVVTGDLTRRTAVVVGLLTALCLLTKGFALVLPVVVAAAYLVHRRAGVPSGVVALAVGGALGGPWYLMNLIRFGKLQVEGLGPVADADFRGPPNDLPHPIPDFLHQVASNLNRRFWGGIGVMDAPSLPSVLSWGLTLLVTALVVVALLRSPGRRQALGVLLLPVPLMLALVTFGALHWWRFNGKLIGVQGRYLYPGLLGTIVVVCVGVAVLLRTRQALAPLLGFAVVAVTQLTALWTVFDAYWGTSLDGVRRVVHWSPWPPVLSLLPFLATAAFGAWALLLVAKGAFARDQGSSGNASLPGT